MKVFQPLLKLFSSPAPVVVHDAFFGRIVYVQSSASSRSYWEARRPFAPCGADIELFIDAPGHEQIPNLEERDFFNWVERDYAKIIANVARVARPVFESRVRGPTGIAFEQAFRLSSFSIPLPADDSAEWEMCFDSCVDPSHILIVVLRGAEPISASMDG